MKILILVCSFFICIHLLNAQNQIIGAGFGNNDWVNPNSFSASAGGSMIFTSTANGTGNQYFRLIANSNQQSPSLSCTPGDDLEITPNNVFTAANTNCTNGAYFYNSANTTDAYVFKTPNATANSFVVFRIQGSVETVATVSQQPTQVFPLQDVTVTASVSGTAPWTSNQSVYLRYTTDNWSNSSIIEMNYNSGQDYIATIPASDNQANATLRYYIFTSASSLSINHSEADWYSINLNNNGGSNYEYTVENAWTTDAGGDGTWDDPAMWDANAVPSIGAPVHIQDDISLDVDATIASLTIDAGAVFTAGDGASRQLTLQANASFTNNGTYNSNLETIIFDGAATVSGTVSFYNVEISGSFDPGLAASVQNDLIIQNGGFINNNSISYNNGSTLIFNTGAVFNLSSSNLEWNNSITPHHLEIRSGTELWLYDDIDRQINGSLLVTGAGTKLIWEHDQVSPIGANLNIAENVLIESDGAFSIYNGDDHNLMSYDVHVAGNFTVAATGQFIMNEDIGDDLKLAGDLINNGVFNSNNRLVVFNGTQLQQLTGVFTGDSRFHYLEVDNSSNIQLNNSIYVEDELRMTNGHTLINTNDLILGDTAECLGTFSASNMIVANQSGRVIKNYSETGAFTFPIGDNTGTAEYSPVTIDITAATAFGATASIQVNLEDIKHPNNPSLNDFLSRHWTVEQTDITGIVYDLTFHYPDADVQGDENNIVGIKTNDNGSNWTTLSPVDAASNQLLLTNQSSFSTFTGGASATFPVELIHFDAVMKDNNVLLSWQTSLEINSDYFVVENLQDNSWTAIAEVPAAGNSTNINTYQATHYNPAAGVQYYRLKQLDIGVEQPVYSQVLAVEVFKRTDIRVFSENDKLIIFDPYQSTCMQASIYDMSGRLVAFDAELCAQSGQRVLQQVALLSNNYYILKLRDPHTNLQLTHQFFKQ